MIFSRGMIRLCWSRRRPSPGEPGARPFAAEGIWADFKNQPRRLQRFADGGVHLFVQAPLFGFHGPRIRPPATLVYPPGRGESLPTLG